MTKPITLRARELADAYALRTLHDYLSQEGFDSFNVNYSYLYNEKERIAEIFSGIQRWRRKGTLDDIVITCLSDLFDCDTEKPNVAVDIAILKNCAIPMTDEERAALKRKYEIDDSRPVVVIGRGSNPNKIMALVEELVDDAIFYLVGFGDTFMVHESYLLERENVHVVNTYGVLKDYYAIADVAIDATYLTHNSNPLHNFVEMTEGAPLFMIPSSNTAQYGYRQLVGCEAIVECGDFMQLLARVRSFVRNFPGNDEHRMRRAQHIHATRERYLPVIKSVIQDPDMSELLDGFTDLEITREFNKLRIMHPDSDWGKKFDKFDSKLKAPKPDNKDSLTKYLDLESKIPSSGRISEKDKLDILAQKYKDDHLPPNDEGLCSANLGHMLGLTPSESMISGIINTFPEENKSLIGYAGIKSKLLGEYEGKNSNN